MDKYHEEAFLKVIRSRNVDGGIMNKRIIRVNYVGFWDSFDKHDNMFTRLLRDDYILEISEKPDFVFCAYRGKPFEYMKYDCIRIMFMGENLSPDWTAFDYWIGFDFMSFGDRYCRFPLAFYKNDGEPWIPERLTHDKAEAILGKKKYFCNFIYRYPSVHGIREALFEELNKYKTVISAGPYLNNNGKREGVSWSEKRDILRASKFTITGDSVSYPGFVTEKIVQPFEEHSIPVYFGNPRVDEDFDPEAFVWCRDSADIPRVIEEVMYLDSDDEAYIEKLMRCPLRSSNESVDKYNELKSFLSAIFDQSPIQAQRRVKGYGASEHEKYLKDYMKQREKTGVVTKIYNLKKRIKKQHYNL